MVRLLAFIGFLGILVAVVAAVYFFGGFYSVAATAEDPGFVNNLLIQVRQASIARHAKDVPSRPPEDAETVRAGARAYAMLGCVNCHGEPPGADWQKWSEGMNPDPPGLKEVGDERQPNELFWVIQNGIKMTGMPSFGKTGVSDDEIWKIVAFVKRFGTVSPADYKAWTATP
jgi:mono/diheme cytochrome c family protein